MRIRLGIGILLFCLVSAGSISANLVDEVDALGPEEALYIRRTLLGKSLDPIPDYFFRRLGVVWGKSAHSIEGDFSPSGGSDMGRVDGWFYGIRYRVNSRLNIGIDSYRGGRNETLRTGNSSFQSTHFDYEHLHLAGDFLIFYESRFSLKLNASWGPTNYRYLVRNYSESGGITLYRPRSGDGYTGQVGLEAAYYMNPIWSIGMGVSYFSAETFFATDDGGTIADGSVDFTGSMIRFFTSLNL